MALKKQNPSCDCCSCTIFQDLFNRADSSSLGSDWTEVAGAAEIASNELKITSANSIMICGSASGPNVFVIGDNALGSNTTGDQARVILGYVDDQNYYYAQVTVCSGACVNLGELEIRKVAAGVDTQLATTGPIIDTNGLSWTTLCYTDTGLLVATYNGPGASYSTAHALVAAGETLTGTQYGVGSGTLTGHITFDAFYVNRIQEGTCEECSFCPACSGGDPPQSLTVVMTGLANLGGFPTCTSCTSFNATYVCDYTLTRGGQCMWVYELPSPICSFTHIVVKYTTTGITITIADNQYGDDGARFMRMNKSTAGGMPSTCYSWSETVNAAGFLIHCNQSSWSATVAA